jgi:hypothetical protein
VYANFQFSILMWTTSPFITSDCVSLIYHSGTK